MERCLVCRATVRSDRLSVHLGSVHPSYHPTRKEEAHLRDLTDRKQPHKSPDARAWFTGKRIAMIAAVGVVGLVVTYALLQPPSATAVNGSAAPDFAFTLTDGSTQSLSSYHGHPIFLWWIATWCPHCTVDTQLFSQTYYSQFHAAGVTTLEIQLFNNLGQSGPSLASFAQANGYSGQAGWIFGSGPAGATTTYDPRAVTDVYYAINSQGVIVTSGTGAGPSFPSILSALGSG